MYSEAIWSLVRAAYEHLERDFPGQHEARSQVMLRFEDPCIGYDQLEIIFKDVKVRFTGGKNPVTLKRGDKMARNIILAIDDTPERYMILARDVEKYGWVVVPVESSKMAKFVLRTYRERILAVMLDHDLGGGWNGEKAAKEHLIEKSHPVIITTNNESAAKRLEDLFEEWAVPYWRASAMGMFKEDHWISVLKEIEGGSGDEPAA